MLVAIARIPADSAALSKAAALTGLALVDVSRLVTGTLPRVLVRTARADGQLVASLEAAGFVAFAVDEQGVATDAQRVVARNVELSATELVAIDGAGRRHVCPASSITTVLRGIRLVESTEITKSTERRLALGKALLTGGLSVTRKVETTTERTTAAKEGFLLLLREDGQPEILLGERRLNYQCLGRDLQPSTHGNLMALQARLRTLAPHAPLDDRITRPGFLAGLPPTSLDPVDLAIHLIGEARSRGC